MKNTSGLYKHQRDNRGARRKLPSSAPKAKLVPVKEYEYEKARRLAAEATGAFRCKREGPDSPKCQRPCDECWSSDIGEQNS